MIPSDYEFQRAISCLREYCLTHRGLYGWIFSRPDEFTYGYSQYPSSDFLMRLGHAVQRAASYQRWMGFAHSLMRFTSLFRMEGD